MKLIRLALAGASAYAIYKYTIGKGAKGEPVFAPPPDEALPNADGVPALGRPDMPHIEDQLSE